MSSQAIINEIVYLAYKYMAILAPKKKIKYYIALRIFNKILQNKVMYAAGKILDTRVTQIFGSQSKAQTNIVLEFGIPSLFKSAAGMVVSIINKEKF